MNSFEKQCMHEVKRRHGIEHTTTPPCWRYTSDVAKRDNLKILMPIPRISTVFDCQCNNYMLRLFRSAT